MDNKFIEALTEWQKEGKRSVEIKIGGVCNEGKTTVWCFDYKLIAGKYAKNISEIPVPGELEKMVMIEAKARLKSLEGNSE